SLPPFTLPPPQLSFPTRRSSDLSDFYGRRRVFLIGLIGFGLTSVLCGLAPNMEFLVASRVLQGAAGAILVPGSLALLTANFSGRSEEHTSELQSRENLVCRLLLE